MRKRMATRVLCRINNLEVQGCQLRTKRNLLEIYCYEIGSSALRLSLYIKLLDKDVITKTVKSFCKVQKADSEMFIRTA